MKNITRENIGEISIAVLDGMNRAFHPTPTILEELPTGFGKTKVALDLINHICKKEALKNPQDIRPRTINVLLLVAKRVHKQTWQDEINKWGGLGYDFVNVNLTIECYESLKNYENGYFEIVICDEHHHIGSDLRLDLLKTLTITELLLGLSATIPRDLKRYFKHHYNAEMITCSLQEAFDTDTLPEPILYLYPMRFDTKEHLEDDTFEVIYNKNKGLPRIYANWSERGRFRFIKNKEIHTHCTKVEYLRELNSEIETLRLAYQRNPEQWRKTKWLRRSKDRLEFLSSCKNDILTRMLGWLDKERTLTFCSTIEQTEVLGSNCIHSKNKNSTQVLEDFNAGRINHITSCQVLNEGVNLTNCRVGIYANINASEIITRQRLGRILRHPKPMVIIPYYVNTREEELVKKMIKEYDPSLIKGIQELFKSYKEEQERLEDDNNEAK